MAPDEHVPISPPTPPPLVFPSCSVLGLYEARKQKETRPTRMFREELDYCSSNVHRFLLDSCPSAAKPDIVLSRLGIKRSLSLELNSDATQRTSLPVGFVSVASIIHASSTIHQQLDRSVFVTDYHCKQHRGSKVQHNPRSCRYYQPPFVRTLVEISPKSHPNAGKMQTVTQNRNKTAEIPNQIVIGTPFWTRFRRIFQPILRKHCS